jgi:hypothetical protein
MQSQKGSTTNKEERPSLPWGHGSASWHGRVWWLTYRTPTGKLMHENAETDDPAEARRLLAQKALPRARAAVAELERIANGETDQGNGPAGEGTRKPGRVGRDRGKALSDTRARKGTKTGGRK